MLLTEISVVSSSSAPDWASYWLINPPAWVLRVTYLAILAVLVAGAWGYRRHGLSPDVLEDASTNVFTFFLSMGLATGLLGTGLPLVAVVAIGGVGGWVAGIGLERAITGAVDS